MRVSEDRYARDLRRLNLARRLLKHQARTQSIRDWTGMTDARVRSLYRSYDPADVIAQRHRGPSPTATRTFIRSPILRCEASSIAGLGCLLGVIPRKPIPDARHQLPGIEAGERLCDVFELYRRIVPGTHFAMDQFILLTLALAEGVDLQLGRCTHCHGALLVDPLAAADNSMCWWCRQALLNKQTRAMGEAILAAHAAQCGVDAEVDPNAGPQQRLF